MRVAKRLENLPPYLFVEITKKIAEKRAKGEDIISFAVGDPDIPTPPHIISRLIEAAQDSTNHRYPESDGLPELRRAVAGWYQKRFDVSLNSEKEVLPLIGAKEGIAHIAFSFIDPGDMVLVPDPAYPVYAIGTILAGGRPHYLPLTAGNNFLPNLRAIPEHILEMTKLLWINYPNNPTGAVADLRFFNQVVEFAKKNDIAVCHDGPYTEVAFDGYEPVSFLQADGAKEVGVEFHSLSKSFNMTGWRIGVVVGNELMVKALMTLKSNIDSGIPQAIQLMAIEALSGSQDCILEHNTIYQRRRDLVVEVLNKIGLEAQTPMASLYVWAKVPSGYTSASFAADLLEQVGVVVTPGLGYGPSGEGYVRLSLTVADASLVKGLSRLAGWRDDVNKFRIKVS
ncbi:MAG: LL-diaminopimelate aminotransferase [Dehalococcoidales bacterium]|jgi:LL-diaminopimelate aminotransferase|nr:LL-diaminopimelate aminotransferase [Dehalococcoidales bacterium]MDP6221895.1 LL-diaminopimelate aminotransferase [Dehalococcoidales bacterium]MDP7109868.1 LL-diaminopimelate aminotransferase [Dehalococcoidales bacterium]MDP7310271.1 LL-diaminopimelate aminotransferase [Dehalococcoidales bacterium]MDP7409263.1 LL-diaminopimelate aminotransferase [Dehalococcoidales bacterium]